MTDRNGPDFLASTRRSYDAVAVHYANVNVSGLQERHPLERAMLDSFSELVRSQSESGRPIADLGCGPGNVTAYLRDRGLDVFGLDLSPVMVDQARRAHPGLSFEVGSMTDVDRPDGVLSGIVAIYSIIHLSQDQVQLLFVEFHRLLAPGGRLLLVFQIRHETWELTRWFDQEVELSYPELEPDNVTRWLAAAGFMIEARMRREPDGVSETVPRCYVLATAQASAQ
jgi:SAM-dependent methyltransferase